MWAVKIISIYSPVLSFFFFFRRNIVKWERIAFVDGQVMRLACMRELCVNHRVLSPCCERGP